MQASWTWCNQSKGQHPGTLWEELNIIVQGQIPLVWGKSPLVVGIMAKPQNRHILIKDPEGVCFDDEDASKPSESVCCSSFSSCFINIFLFAFSFPSVTCGGWSPTLLWCCTWLVSSYTLQNPSHSHTISSFANPFSVYALSYKKNIDAYWLLNPVSEFYLKQDILLLWLIS